jgi:DNA-binding GntR family transcriptional regulator
MEPRHGAKGDTVVDFLMQAIQAGRFVPGQRLVEADLTAELGVSRSLLREAFRRLSAEGVIEIVPNRGALVRRLTMTEAMELFEIRLELEALAARLAAEKIADPGTRERFERRITPIWEEVPRFSTSDYLAENRRFHAAVFEAAGNGQLVKLNSQLQLSLIMAQIASELTGDVMMESLHEHRVVASAILAGDAAAADAAIRGHLSRARDFVRAIRPEVFRAGRPGEAVPFSKAEFAGTIEKSP